MTAGHGLVLVIVAFMAIMAAVLATAFRERRVSQRIASGDQAAASDSDARILLAIFVGIPGGMLLRAVTAWLVYF